jgi:tRNA1(Val) A37 N6-methylase TrmN6
MRPAWQAFRMHENLDEGGVTDSYSDDWYLDGRLLLRQPVAGHRIGTDALLLAAASPAKGRVCDLGSGVGAVGLALAMRGASETVLVERDLTFAGHARHNIASQNEECVGARVAVRLVMADVFNRKSFLQEPALADQSFDTVATNPPYDQGLKGRRTPSALKHAAHAMEGGDLAAWLAVATRLLRDGGVLTLIHRADRLADVLAALPKRAGGIVIRPVQPQADTAATRILVQATAGSREALTLLPPFLLHARDGRFTPEAEMVHKGRATLSMSPGPLIAEAPGQEA